MEFESERAITPPQDLQPQTVVHEQPRVLTPSMIALFVDCPRRYAFRYVERVPSPIYPAAFAFGRALHAAAEDALGGPNESVERRVERAQSRFLTVFREECTVNPVAFAAGDSAERSEQVGLHLVGLLVRTLPREEVVAVEVPFEVSLDRLLAHRRPTVLRGRLDLRLADGAVGELKTTARGLQPRFLAESPQLRAYALALYLLHGTIPEIRVIELVKDQNTTSLRLLSFQFPKQALAEFLRQVRRMLTAIDEGNFPRRVSGRCHWCEYETPCKASETFS